MPKSILIRVVSVLLIPCLLGNPSFAAKPVGGFGDGLHSSKTIAAAAMNEQALATPAISKPRGARNFWTLIVFVLGAVMASGQIKFPAHSAAQRTIRPASELSLQHVLERGSTDDQMRLIDWVLTEVQRRKLSPTAAAAAMELPPDSAKIFIEHGVLVIGSAGREAKLVAMASILGVDQPGSNGGVRFVIAPDQSAIDEKYQNRGAFYSFDYKGIVFVYDPSLELWEHEFGHYLHQSLSHDDQVELGVHWTKAGEAMKQFSEYAYTGHPDDRNQVDKEQVAIDLGGNAFAEVNRLWKLHSDQLVQNPEIMGKNPDLSYYLEQCAKTYVFHRDGKTWLRTFRPSWQGRLPEVVILPILDPDKGGPSLVDQLRSIFTELGPYGNPDFPLEFAQARIRQTLQSVEHWSRGRASEQLNLPKVSQAIYIDHGIAVLAPTKSETARLDNLLDVLWPAVGDHLRYILVRPGEGHSTVCDFEGKGLVIHGAMDEDDFLNALGTLMFNNLFPHGDDELATEFFGARQTFAAISPDIDRPEKAFTAVVRLLYRHPEKLLLSADIYGDFAFWRFLERVHRELDFISNGQLTRRIYPFRNFDNKNGFAFREYSLSDNAQNFSSDRLQYLAFDPQFVRITTESMNEALQGLAGESSERRRRGVAYFAEAYATAANHQDTSGLPYFHILGRILLENVAGGSPDYLEGLLKALDDPAAMSDAQLVLDHMPPPKEAQLQESLLRTLLRKAAALSEKKELIVNSNARETRDRVVAKLREFIGGACQESALRLLDSLLHPEGSMTKVKPLRRELLDTLNDEVLLSRMYDGRLPGILDKYLEYARETKDLQMQGTVEEIQTLVKKLMQKHQTNRQIVAKLTVHAAEILQATFPTWHATHPFPSMVPLARDFLLFSPAPTFAPNQRVLSAA
jgi:hypothetical protein